MHMLPKAHARSLMFTFPAPKNQLQWETDRPTTLNKAHHAFHDAHFVADEQGSETVTVETSGAAVM